MFHPRRFENSRPDGIAVLEVVPQEDEKTDDATRDRQTVARQFVPLRRTELFGTVAGPLADLRLVQTFGYSRDVCDRVLEALYRFPLPGDAAVRGVRVRFGDVEIEAELKEREQAQAEYDAARAEGRQAALATRESVDVFTLRVAGLQPDQDIVVETSYVQLAQAEGTGWLLRVPLTTAPRYVRSDERDSAAAQGQPLAVLRDPGHRFRLEVGIKDAGEVRSPTHALKTTQGEQGVMVELQEGEVLPDRDCVLVWEATEQGARPTFSIYTHGDTQTGAGEDQLYFLAQVSPPRQRAPSNGGGANGAGEIAREVTLLVDHSGSMAGAKWDAADWAVERFLGDLGERDSFALAVFHSTTRWFRQEPVAATRKNVADAVAWLKSASDGGGTELGVALEQALRLKKTPGERARHLLVLTDAAVSDSARILRLAEAESAAADRRRISVICIDAAPNSYLALELAKQGGGVARFLTSSPEEDDIVTALDEVLADWSAPVLAGLQLGVDRQDVDVAGRQVVQTKNGSLVDLGDLPSGRSIWVVGRGPLEGKTGAHFTLQQSKAHDSAAPIADATVVAGAFPALKALFGARKVNALEYLIGAGYHGAELRQRLERLGYDPASLEEGAQTGSAPVYAENVRAEAKAAIESLLARESLRYGLASSATGFVAVRREAGKPVEETVAVANALPAGWSDEFAGGPHFQFMASAPPQSALFGASMLPPSSGVPQRMARTLMDTAASMFARPKMQTAPQPVEERKQSIPREGEAVVFSGRPAFDGAQAILFDSAESPNTLAQKGRITGIHLRGVKADDANARAATLWIFVGDLAQPRARVRLADLARQGERPLNLAWNAGDVVRIVLDAPPDAQATWGTIEVVLRYVT